MVENISPGRWDYAISHYSDDHSRLGDDFTESLDKFKGGPTADIIGEFGELLDPDLVFFERDTRQIEGDEKSDRSEEKHVVLKAVVELLRSDPEFKAAFMKAQANGLRFHFRFNADDTRASLINGNILQIDIALGDDVKAELKKNFSKDRNWQVQGPGEGPRFEEVIADDGMSGEEFVAHMERLGHFSFSGEHGGKIRKDVIYMYDNSAFMRALMRDTLSAPDTKKKFNFSNIGEGGGTVSRPFEDFATSVNAHGGYEGVSTEDYDPASEGNWGIMAHEMMHSFLEIGDTPAIDVAGAIVAKQTGTQVGKLAYDERHKGSIISIDDDFDISGFMKAARNGGIDDLDLETILNRFGGGTISPILKDDTEYNHQFNELVSGIVKGVNVDKSTAPPMEGHLADQYKRLLIYNMRHHGFRSWQEASHFTKHQLLERLSKFPDAVDIFWTYLERQGGNGQLHVLAIEAWSLNHGAVP